MSMNDFNSGMIPRSTRLVKTSVNWFDSNLEKLRVCRISMRFSGTQIYGFMIMIWMHRFVAFADKKLR